MKAWFALFLLLVITAPSLANIDVSVWQEEDNVIPCYDENHCYVESLKAAESHMDFVLIFCTKLLMGKMDFPFWNFFGRPLSSKRTGDASLIQSTDLGTSPSITDSKVEDLSNLSTDRITPELNSNHKSDNAQSLMIAKPKKSTVESVEMKGKCLNHILSLFLQKEFRETRFPLFEVTDVMFLSCRFLASIMAVYWIMYGLMVIMEKKGKDIRTRQHYHLQRLRMRRFLRIPITTPTGRSALNDNNYLTRNEFDDIDDYQRGEDGSLAESIRWGRQLAIAFESGDSAGENAELRSRSELIITHRNRASPSDPSLNSTNHDLPYSPTRTRSVDVKVQQPSFKMDQEKSSDSISISDNFDRNDNSGNLRRRLSDPENVDKQSISKLSLRVSVSELSLTPKSSEESHLTAEQFLMRQLPVKRLSSRELKSEACSEKHNPLSDASGAGSSQDLTESMRATQSFSITQKLKDLRLQQHLRYLHRHRTEIVDARVGAFLARVTQLSSACIVSVNGIRRYFRNEIMPMICQRVAEISRLTIARARESEVLPRVQEVSRQAADGTKKRCNECFEKLTEPLKEHSSKTRRENKVVRICNTLQETETYRESWINRNWDLLNPHVRKATSIYDIAVDKLFDAFEFVCDKYKTTEVTNTRVKVDDLNNNIETNPDITAPSVMTVNSG